MTQPAAASKVMNGTVVVASPDEPLTASVRDILIPEGFRVLARPSGAAAFELARQLRLDVMLVDTGLLDMPAEKLCADVRDHSEAALTPLLIIPYAYEQECLERCFDAGAEDAIARPVSAPLLRTRVRTLVRMRHRLESLLAAQANHTSLASLVRVRIASLAEQMGLSAREREALDLVVLGRSTSEMAIAMSISERTAKFHVANVLRKLGIESRLELFRLLL